MNTLNIVSLFISLVAVGVAFWQGFLSKAQLEQAKSTKDEANKLLDEIKTKVAKVETISDETRKDVKEQISKLIDKQDENFKVLLNAPNQNSQNEMIMSLLPSLLEKPDILKTFIELGQKDKK
ncbi:MULTISPECIES: hypothetical protein [unclassified Francisella]|uniref:hypothetical protein n=1 Tax=unclassified Francisella TaxID=2610885 RepID=UPI001788CED9|nr:MULTISPECIES: hypothetical protein [unclassified Francisella]MED7818395.1 hypothetical protein [Francisella sp. 19S2-4]MED7829231.1 hypothetical protein [Francisella sp. 19S2-10]QIW10511.1 hypothetical protein FIP56_07300 [Francisella sp. LA112445]